jgi:hypothetical protein
MAGFEEATLVHEVDLLDRYSMNLHGLAQSLGLTPPGTLALVYYINLQTDPDCYREFRIGESVFKRYSPEALEKLGEVLKSVDMEAVFLHLTGREIRDKITDRVPSIRARRWGGRSRVR